jgi:hypothetical protein
MDARPVSPGYKIARPWVFHVIDCRRGGGGARRPAIVPKKDADRGCDQRSVRGINQENLLAGDPVGWKDLLVRCDKLVWCPDTSHGFCDRGSETAAGRIGGESERMEFVQEFFALACEKSIVRKGGDGGNGAGELIGRGANDRAFR